MKTYSSQGVSALAGLVAALCCSVAWLGAGLAILVTQGGVA